MNSNSFIKFLTGVCFVLVGLSFSFVNAEPVTTAVKTPAELYQQLCTNNKWKEGDAYSSIDECKKAVGLAGTDNSSCDTAYQEFLKESADARKACTALVSKSTTTRTSRSSGATDVSGECNKKIDQCEKSMNAISTGGAADRNGIIAGAFQIYQTMKGTATNTATNGATSTPDSMSCFKNFGSSEYEKQIENIKKEKKELEDDKKKLEDAITEEKDEQNKKDAEIKKGIQELEKAKKEEDARIDKETNEEAAKASRQTVDSGKRIRELNRKITQANDKIRSLQFNHSNTLLSLTSDKINQQCRDYVNKATSCMVNSVKNPTANSADCSSFPKLNSTGTKAKAELVRQVKIIQERCYETADLEKKNKNFENQEKIKSLQDEIAEMQSQLADEKKQLEISSTESQKIQQIAQQQKADATNNLMQQTQNLNNDLLNFVTNSNTKMQKNNERIVELMKQIEAVEAKLKIGASSVIEFSRTSLGKSDDAFDSAYAKCGCKGDEKTGNCYNLKTKNPNKPMATSTRRNRVTTPNSNSNQEGTGQQ
ncbi:MAG: hypothetical protein ACK41T_11070 [Pseudobdellovibrio sp.]